MLVWSKLVRIRCAFPPNCSLIGLWRRWAPKLSFLEQFLSGLSAKDRIRHGLSSEIPLLLHFGASGWNAIQPIPRLLQQTLMQCAEFWYFTLFYTWPVMIIFTHIYYDPEIQS
jgi:hypothetical protein